MRTIPECLNRRYNALDDLIDQLNNSLQSQDSPLDRPEDSNNAGIKLMCNFWKIMKDNPKYNLPKEVQRVCNACDPKKTAMSVYGPRQYWAFMAGQDNQRDDRSGEPNNRPGEPNNRPGETSNRPGEQSNRPGEPSNRPGESSNRPGEPSNPPGDPSNPPGKPSNPPGKPSNPPGKPTNRPGEPSNRPGEQSDQPGAPSDRIRQLLDQPEMSSSKSYKCATCKGEEAPTPAQSNDWPLNKVLCSLNEAADVDKKCHAKVKELMIAQALLKEHIQELENKEKHGNEMLKEADAIWLSMETSYKKKLAEVTDNNSLLLKQLKEVETSASKWRKNKKDLLFQIQNMEKLQREIKDDINQKKNDLKIIDNDIGNLKKRVTSNTTDLENLKKSMSSKKEAADTRMAALAEQMNKLQKKTAEQLNNKKLKEEEGSEYVKDARNDLQKLCKVLIKKRLENEDLRAESKGILDELEILTKTANTCKTKCDAKEQNLKDEIKKLTEEIENYKVKCIQCHVCTDTNDTRRLCIDCPRCSNERECLYESEYCSADATMDCVCMAVKQKFLDNVFENMYTILEQQAKTSPGKAVADAILDSLKRSRNGKLSPEVRKILQDFILTTVKKNLNLTIVGGAVKTRCEMDPETYKQLMLCLNDITESKPENKTVGTTVKKDPCAHWGGTSECQCPRGPKFCVCTKSAPPPLGSSKTTPCNQDDAAGPVMVCPEHAPKPCSADCGNQGKGKATIATDLAKWRPDPCSESNCTYSQNMRAQCVLNSKTGAEEAKEPVLNSTSSASAPCACGSLLRSPCPYNKDAKQLKDTGTSYHKLSLVKQKALKATARKTSKPIPIYMKSIPEKTKRTLNEKQRVPYTLNNEVFTSHKNIPHEKLYKTFKIIIDKNSSKQVGSLVTTLKRTPSGSNVMDLDEEFDTLIEKKMNDRPRVFISLHQTKSGQLLMDFDNENNKIPIMQRVILFRTPSGTNVLEMQKQMLDIIQGVEQKEVRKRTLINNSRNQTIRGKNSTPNEPRITNKRQYSKQYSKISNNSDTFKSGNEPLVYVKLRRMNKISDLSHPNKSNKINFILNKTSQTSSANVSYQTSESKVFFHNYAQEFNQSYENGKIITLNIEKNNKLLHKIKTFVSKSPSGTVYINLSKSLDVIPLNITNPVHLSKIKSDNYSLNIDYKNSTPNAVIKKCVLSGNIILIPAVENIEHNEDENFFKVKVVGCKDYPVSLPVVLNATESGNYMIILDKEFEKRYEKSVQDYIGNERECFVLLKKTSSGYLIDLNTNGSIPAEELNALLVKSSAGEIKILVKDVRPTFDFIDRVSKRSSLSSAQVFESLLGKLQPVSSREIHRENLRKSKFISQKCNSDSEFYERVKIKLQINKDLLSDTTGIIKKSKSGQYAILLNKDSKKDFINNLRNYLISNPKGFTPIEKTDSGQILIRMNSIVGSQQHSGAIKITSSGNIYILAEEEPVTEMNTEVCTRCPSSNSVDNKSVQFDTLNEVVTKESKCITTNSKAIATNCCGHPGRHGCDVSRCACSELVSETLLWLRPHYSDSNNAGHKKGANCVMDIKFDPAVANLSESSSVSSFNMSPYAVIKPAPDSQPKKASPKKCYYVYNTMCPYHKGLPNDLMVTPRYFTKPSEERITKKSINETEIKSVNVNKDENNTQIDTKPTDSAQWDSLQYLPPQLPYFLRSMS